MIYLRPGSVLLLAGVIFLLAACGGKTHAPVFYAETNPTRLSEWDVLFVNDRQLHLSKNVISYDLNTALFSDYAHKLRTVWVPDGTAARYTGSDAFEFPVGSIISKTFYYPVSDEAAGGNHAVLKSPDTTSQRLNTGFDLRPVRLIETRLLVRRQDGWSALPYVWNDAQTDATLKRTGEIKPLTLVSSNQAEDAFAYIVPNENQCAGCHATNATTREIKPIGLKARHLNKTYDYGQGPAGQLRNWAARGVLTDLPDPAVIPANALWDDTGNTVDKRARAYLDINCSHCHNQVGPADTSGLYLEADSSIGPHLGLCKLPIAAGTGTGNRKYGIVPGKPDESIFVYRMASVNAAEMMPELGRSIAHAEGVALISTWIYEMTGACE